jgi:hypothetical protein
MAEDVLIVVTNSCSLVWDLLLMAPLISVAFYSGRATPTHCITTSEHRVLALPGPPLANANADRRPGWPACRRRVSSGRVTRAISGIVRGHDGERSLSGRGRACHPSRRMGAWREYEVPTAARYGQPTIITVPWPHPAGPRASNAMSFPTKLLRSGNLPGAEKDHPREPF